MLRIKRQVLAATCLSALGLLAGTVDANAAAGDIWGGGASVIAPYWRQFLDCYALPAQLIVQGSPTPTLVSEPPFNYVSQDCSTQHIETDRTAYYISSSSGNGILSIFSHDPTLWGYINTADTTYAPEVNYDLSETPLTSIDVGVYDNGGTETQGSKSVNVNTTTSGQACNTNVGGTYANPAACFGPLVQFPVSVDPLAIAFAPVYEKVLNADNSVTSYKFHLKYPRTDGSGGLRLDATTYCKIFNGQITNWNDPALTALNGGVSLEDPSDPTPSTSWSIPLQIVGRSDSAGTTSTLTRHLAAVCAGLISGNDYSTGSSTLPTALQGPTYNTANPNYPGVVGEKPGIFTLAPKNPGVAQYVAFTISPGGSNPTTIQQGRITYIGEDYVLPYVLKTNTNTYGLNSATLKNALRAWVAPGPTGAADAFKGVRPPQSNSTGSYNAGITTWGLRANPQDWVQGTSPTSPLANPTTAGSYPIVGTANFLGYQCYASSTQVGTIIDMFTYDFTKPINTSAKGSILASSGFAPLTAQWKNAITGTFLKNTDGLGLNIAATGTAGTCSASGIVGG